MSPGPSSNVRTSAFDVTALVLSEPRAYLSYIYGIPKYTNTIVTIIEIIYTVKI